MVVTVKENHFPHWWHILWIVLSSPALAEMFDCLKPLQIFKAQERCHCLFSQPTSNTRTHEHTSKRASCQSLTTNIDRNKASFLQRFLCSFQGNWQGLSETQMLMLVTSSTRRDTHTTRVHSTTRFAVFVKPWWWGTLISLIILAFKFDIFSVWQFFSQRSEKETTKRFMRIQDNNTG